MLLTVKRFLDEQYIRKYGCTGIGITPDRIGMVTANRKYGLDRPNDYSEVEHNNCFDEQIDELILKQIQAHSIVSLCIAEPLCRYFTMEFKTLPKQKSKYQEFFKWRFTNYIKGSSDPSLASSVCILVEKAYETEGGVLVGFMALDSRVTSMTQRLVEKGVLVDRINLWKHSPPDDGCSIGFQRDKCIEIIAVNSGWVVLMREANQILYRAHKTWAKLNNEDRCEKVRKRVDMVYRYFSQKYGFENIRIAINASEAEFAQTLKSKLDKYEQCFESESNSYYAQHIQEHSLAKSLSFEAADKLLS